MAVAYWLGATIAFEIAEASGLGAVLFVPAGLTVGAMLRLPRHQWWLVVAAAGATEFVNDLGHGFEAEAAAGFATANALEPLVGALLTHRWCGRTIDLGRRRHVGGFVIGAAIIAPIVGAGIGALTDRLFVGDAIWTTGWQWWLGDGLGVLVVGGAIVATASTRDRRSLISLLGISLTLGTAALIVVTSALWDLPLQLPIMTLVIAAGALLGTRGVAATAAFAAGALAVSIAFDDSTMWPGVADSTALALSKGQLAISIVLGLLLAAEVAERETGAARAARAALRLESEAQLRSVFDSIDDGFCLAEMIVDDRGAPVDYRFIQVNPRFESMSGLVDPVGKTALEVLPNLEPEWIERYARVGLDRESGRFELGSAAMGRQFEVSAVPVDPHGRFAIVFRDVSERHRSEATRRQAAALDAYRVRLSDTLWLIHDVPEVRSAAAMLLRDELAASTVVVLETDLDSRESWRRAPVGQPEDTRLGDYGPTVTARLETGEIVVVVDVSERSDLESAAKVALLHRGVRSFVITPVIRSGRMVSAVVVHDNRQRTWTPEEVALVAETASRCWAETERARAQTELAARHRRAALTADLLSKLEFRSMDDLVDQVKVLTDTLVPDFADLATVEMPEADEPLLAVAHVDPTWIPDFTSTRRLGRHPSKSSARLAAARQPVLLHRDSAPVEPIHGGIDAHAGDLLVQLDCASLMAVPLHLGNGRRATLMVGRNGSFADPFGPDDLAFLEDVATRAGLVIAAAHHRQLEHEISHRLQRALLPDEVARHPNLEIEPRYYAASDLMEVGGDWYDTFSWPDGQMGLIVGDVVGHDLDAAATMGRLRAVAGALAIGLPPSPAQLLDALDDYARGTNGRAFTTAFCAIVDPQTGRLTYSCAGHPPALVVGIDGGVARLDQALSPPLCVQTSAGRRAEATVEMTPGSVLVAYSDGLVERRKEVLDIGIDRLAEEAAASIDMATEHLADHLIARMIEGVRLDDDIVLALLRFSPPRSTSTCTVPADFAELHDLRDQIRRWLVDCEVTDGQHGDIVLAVSEAVANAIEHAYRDEGSGDEVDVTLADHHHHLTVTVRDRGSWRQPVSEAGIRGRGLLIMRSLCRHVEVDKSREGTTVSLTIGIDRSGGDHRSHMS